MEQGYAYSVSPIESNFTTGLGPIHVLVNLTIREDLSILYFFFLTMTKLCLISVVRTW